MEIFVPLSILQRYVLKELVGPFGLGMLVFTFAILVGQLLRLTSLLLTSDVSPMVAGELILALLPNIFSVTIPMAILQGTLLGVGRLAADREILAIRTSGVNLFRVFIPVLVCAGVMSGALAWLNQSFVPYLNLKLEDLKIQVAFTALSALPPDQPKELESVGGGPASTFFYERRDPETKALQGIRIHTRVEQVDPLRQKAEDQVKEEIRRLQNKKDAQSKAKLTQLRHTLEDFALNRKMNEALILAHSGVMRADMVERMITIELTSGTINVVNPDDPAAHTVVQFASMTKNLFPDTGRHDARGVYKKKLDAMTSQELIAQKDQIAGKKRNPLVAEYYRRFSVPLACIAFALIAIPLAVYARPTGKAVAFALSFFLILIYYGLLNFGLSLGETGKSMAVFAIFFPNILLAGVGAVLMYRMVMR